MGNLQNINKIPMVRIPRPSAMSIINTLAKIIYAINIQQQWPEPGLNGGMMLAKRAI